MRRNPWVRVWFFCWVALSLLVDRGARAAEVYGQPPAAAGGLIASSWIDPNGSDSDMYAWDAFALAADQQIAEVSWRGGYLYNAYYGPVVDFRIRIYESIAGGFQPNVVKPPLVSYSVGGTAGETYAGSFGGTAMYDYRFTLPTPFPAKAGVKYWMQIEGVQRVYPDWALAVGTGGDGSHFMFSTGAHRYWSASADTAFALHTAASQTYSIGGNIALRFYASPVGGVTVTAGGQSAITTANGNYLITGLDAGTYIVACSLPGYGFEPISQELRVGPSRSGIDFKAYPTATISGRVTLNGVGLSGVTMFAGGYSAVTGPDGTYVITDLLPGQYYTSCLGRAGYTFAPPWVLALANPDAVGIDFTATSDLPPPPTGLSALPGNDRIELAWDAAAGAQSYRVKRGTASGGPYSVVGDGVTANGYVDLPLSGGTAYFYVVSSVNSKGEGPDSAELQTSTLPNAPLAPSGLMAFGGAGAVDLSWSAVTDAAYYRVKRSALTGGPYTVIAENVLIPSFGDRLLAPGTTWFYVVSAVSPGGESSDSAEAQASTDAGLASVTVSPAQVRGGRTARGTVALTGTARRAVTVLLASSGKAAAVPKQVVIKQGASSATFTITTRTVKKAQTVVLSAQLGEESRTTSLLVRVK